MVVRRKQTMTITRDLIKKLRNDIDAALVQVGKANGVSIRAGNASFDDATVKYQLKVTALSSDGTVVDTARRDYELLAAHYGLKKEWLDQTFRTLQGTFKISGLKLSRRKFPVDAKDIRNGKTYKFPIDAIVRHMGGKPKEPLFGSVPTWVPLSTVPPAKNPNHDRIVMLINDLKSNGPENYYADGEHRAAGMTEKQIYDMHYDRFSRTLA
jgi:hypothetical protein